VIGFEAVVGEKGKGNRERRLIVHGCLDPFVIDLVVGLFVRDRRVYFGRVVD